METQTDRDVAKKKRRRTRVRGGKGERPRALGDPEGWYGASGSKGESGKGERVPISLGLTWGLLRGEGVICRVKEAREGQPPARIEQGTNKKGETREVGGRARVWVQGHVL